MFPFSSAAVIALMHGGIAFSLTWFVFMSSGFFTYRPAISFAAFFSVSGIVFVFIGSAILSLTASFRRAGASVSPTCM